MRDDTVAECTVFITEQIKARLGLGSSASCVHVRHDARTIRVLVPYLCQFEAGRAHKVINFSIQMASAGNLAPKGSEPALPPFDPRLGRKPVFDEEQFAAGPEHALHLAQCGERFWDRTKRPCHDDRVDCVVSKWDRGRGRLDEANLNVGRVGVAARLREQRERGIDPDNDLDLFAIERKIQSRTNSDFEHSAGGGRHGVAAIFFELALTHDQIEQRRKEPALINVHVDLPTRPRSAPPELAHGVGDLRNSPPSTGFAADMAMKAAAPKIARRPSHGSIGASSRATAPHGG